MSHSHQSLQCQPAIMPTIHVYLALLGLMSFILSPVTSLAVEVQSVPRRGPLSTSISTPGADGGSSPWIQPIDPPGPPVPTKLPEPTGTPFIIDTRPVVKVNTGQSFLINLDNFLSIFGDGIIKVNTDPVVSWVSLNPERRAITGLVPVDYAASRVLVYLTGQYAMGGRVINLRYVVALDVHRSAPSSTSRSASHPNLLPVRSDISRSVSISTPTMSPLPTPVIGTTTVALSAGLPFEIPAAPFLRNVTDDVNTLRTDPVSPWVGFKGSGLGQAIVGVVPADLPYTTVAINMLAFTWTRQVYTVTLNIVIGASAGSNLSSTTTKPLTTSTTVPSALPNRTLFLRESFSILLDPYKRSTGDIVTSVSTEPKSDWVGFIVYWPISLTGHVPGTQPPGRIKVTLSLDSRVTGSPYTASFTIFVRAEPTGHLQ